MSPTTRPAAITRGLRSVVGSGLVAVATCGSLLALSGLISHGRWVGATVTTVIALAAVTAGVRSITRSWWAPTLVGMIVAVLGLLVAYGGPPGRIQVLPDTSSIDRLTHQVSEALALIEAAFVPMDPSRPVELLVVGGAAAVFLLADLVALGLGAPAWSGLVLVSMWAPAVLLGFPAPVRALGWTALAYLLLLALSIAPPTPQGALARRATWTMGAAVCVVVASLSAGPIVTAMPGWASFDLPDLGSGPIGPLRLSDDLDLRESLGQRSGQVVLRYTVTAPDGTAPDNTSVADPLTSTATPTPEAPTPDARLVGPLRAFTLQDFDGRSWQRTEATELVGWPADRILTSDVELRGSEPDGQEGVLARVDVTIDALREQRLPVSTFPRTVEVAGPWLYDEARDEVIGDGSTDTDMAYAMTVQVPPISADSLRRASGTDLTGADGYLEVPVSEHTDEILGLAEDITSTADGRYEQALALQTYLRDAQNFTYDTRVAPAQSDDAVWDFLETRRGYCVQFATSMAVMARLLGIPARLGVGFLPGTPDQDRVYTVTGKQSHAWPELYFPGSGWVRFEPTPAVQSGAPPVWSDPFAAATAAPGIPEVTRAPGASVNPSRTATEAPELSGPDGETELPTAVIGGGALIVLLLVLTAAGAIVQQRRTRRITILTPESAWARLRARLAPVDIVWSDAQTPRQVVALVRRRVVELRGIALSTEADAALLQLAAAVQQDRYAPEPSAATTLVLEDLIGQVLTDVTRDISAEVTSI